MFIILTFLLLLFGCSSSVLNFSSFTSQNTYSNLKQANKSCSGRGFISTNALGFGKLSFSYKSQRDSTFLDFNDILGRKAVLMWITSDFVIVRNLIENQQYEYDQIVEFLPFLKVMKPIEITRMLWGFKPEYYIKTSEKSGFSKKNINLRFDKHSKTLSGARFYDGLSEQTIDISITDRNLNDENVNLKKVWKLLEY